MDNSELKHALIKRLADAEYWSGKNGYEQEAMREVIAILDIVIKQLIGKPQTSSPTYEEYEGRDIGDIK